MNLFLKTKQLARVSTQCSKWHIVPLWMLLAVAVAMPAQAQLLREEKADVSGLDITKLMLNNNQGNWFQLYDQFNAPQPPRLLPGDGSQGLFYDEDNATIQSIICTQDMRYYLLGNSNRQSADIPFSETVRLAKEQGFSEPDPRIDLSGTDVIRKLVILSREAGYEVNQSDVEADLFIPKEFFDCSEEEFWRRLPSLDAGFEARRRELEAQGRRWRFVAKMEDGKYSVSLRDVPMQHSFYVLDGSNNIILLTTERYNRHPMLIQGYGAGADVTAAGVFADIMSIANI